MAGKISRSNANSDCRKCDANYYSSGGENITCQQCPLAKPFTENKGAMSLGDCKMISCSPGKGLPSDYSTATCSTCGKGFFSSGGKGAVCMKCPSEKPYTYWNGAVEMVGAKNGSYCAAIRTCKPGEGITRHANNFVTSGQCTMPISNSVDCQVAAEANRKIDGNLGFYGTTSFSAEPEGCIRCTESCWGKYRNKYMYNTNGDDACGDHVICICGKFQDF